MNFAKIFSAILAIAASAFPVFAEELPPAEEGTFSLAIIPDTQHYKTEKTGRKTQLQATTTNRVFEAITDCIVEELERQRIVFVSHVGDIVDINN
nr:serine/threonine protein phosphatase [Planctomycetota bacterium]